MLARLLNSAWMWHGRHEARAFALATQRVRQTQEDLLLAMVRANAESDYGRRYQFGTIRSVRDYQSRVPVVSYADLSAWIEAIAAGRQGVLTSEPVLMFEPTGGSSGGLKLIPYTVTLRRQFERAIACWIRDVMQHFPRARNGVAYWSVSPTVQRGRSSGGCIPVGFDSDLDYLGVWQRQVAKRLVLPPREVSQLRNIENFRYATLACLLASPSLSLISIWSPTFLTALLEGLDPWGDSVCRDLADGILRLPLPGEELASWRLPWRKDRSRARHLHHKLSSNAARREKLIECWPGLALVSSWADAAAGLHLAALRSWLPEVPIQPKGLLATEGVVSFPLTGYPGAVLAVRSHFFEFFPFDSDGASLSTPECRLAHELAAGSRYRVVLSTGGGLYRYDLGDLVECVGQIGECPLVRFLGRSAAVTDLVGEKLHETHVQSCLTQVCERFHLCPELMLMTPSPDAPLRYRVIFAIPPDRGPIPATDALAEAIDAALRTNPQYDYARGLRQLASLEVCILSLPPGAAWQRYQAHCVARGQKIGDIKPTVLDASAEITL